ncbi:hypothetical protein CTEN210_13394 [Chaetoceros tenuissimus]|uniref:Uncharacterized protein n=1 Tax=Chaetoceros tenuissimus TaxID=426638 RepID=A0AAD3D391_9STRA|nr:hypothetical protein CTEN210_13394 [Chaetoceros tenuissimus]
MRISLILVASLSLVNGFVLQSSSLYPQTINGLSSKTRFAASTSEEEIALPTLDQLKSDSFIDQVGYASQYVPLLSQEDIDVADMIEAQLSHSDGIRGFFVSYLTGDSPSPADEEVIPAPLKAALESQKSSSDLISLTCMNVIMPTGMITMHTDEELSNNSKMTSKRGIIVAKALLAMNKESGNVEMLKQCQAILKVAKGEVDSEDEDVKYWIEFFSKWGYGDKEKENIAKAMEDLMQ